MAEEPHDPKKYFTVAEAEALIPELTRITQGVTGAHSEAQRIRTELAGEQRRIMVSGGGIIDTRAWRARTQRLAALGRQVKEGVSAIMSLGGVPKDLGMGLVDFPFLLEGEEVNLCWRFGEKEIHFWHGLDEGFAGRKPIPGHLT